MAFFGKQNFIAAISSLRKALQLAPFEWIIAYNLGLVFLHTEQYASAFHYLSASINLKPDFASSYVYLAICLNKLEDFENACAAYEKAISLERDHVFHLNYAIMLINNEQLEMGNRQFQTFESMWEALSPDERAIDKEVEGVRAEVKQRIQLLAGQ
eukprot:TRINITY_DN16779_c0_g1_i1.p1 TRINITY_DN16779_c0_g1~~TRINITY_DN16779_c0_g1_i1.p1  ORF type:complete len:156 (+),score=15.06 TRINITY_DN16779_c0_g1_i1:231-698(+)